MKLVIGGRGAGKREFVKNTWNYNDCDIADGVINNCVVIFNLQNIPNLSNTLIFEQLLKKDVVICDEIGCGIVPITEHDRAWREETGRCCIALAKQAEAVVRVCCGIGTAIKGDI